MITTSRLCVLGVLAFVSACSTPSESTCGAGTEADACIGSGGSSGGSTSSGMTTFMTSASSADDTTTAGSASGASTTLPSTTAESSAGESESVGTDATQGTSSSEGSGTTGEPITCPNGIIDEGEQCDGAALGGNDCATLGFVGGELSCAADCSFDPSACIGLASCGNGALDPGEQCDGRDLGGASCEDAGDQYAGGELGCSDNCSFDTSSCCVGFGSNCAVHECCGELLFCTPFSQVCI